MLRHLPALLAVLLLMAPGGARGDDAFTIGDAAPPPDAAPLYLRDAVAGGDHWRFETARGPVHVWIPPGYDAATAGIVLYVHGHVNNADQAWTQHHLPEQFLASQRNAMFIVMEAAISRRDTVKWPSLAALLREVRRQTGLIRPWGPVVAIGHSGAYTTILRWLDYRPLETVILLDALYGHEEYFEDWLYGSAGKAAKHLVLVAADTLRWSEPFARRNKGVAALEVVPPSSEEVPEDDRQAKVLYMRSQFPHMEIVTQRQVIPVALHLTRLPRIE